MPDARERLVLDTNVWLDLLVFRDRRLAPLLDALESGLAVACVNGAVVDELARVLGYSTLALEPDAREGVVEAMRHRSLAIEAPFPTGLPRCRDRDDQKFLELAAACGASALLSRDLELLTLAPRLRRAGLFDVLTPTAWCARQPGPPA